MINPAIIRILKIVALLGFALPWFAVSCGGQTLIEAKGYELVMGAELKPKQIGPGQSGMFGPGGASSNPFADAATDPADETTSGSGEAASKPWKPSPIVQGLAAGAAAALVLGLLIGLALKGGAFNLVSAITSLGAAGAAYATVAIAESGFRDEIAAGMAQSGQQDPSVQGMAAMSQGMFAFTMEPGVWLTIGAAVIAGLICLFAVMGGRNAAAAAPPMQPPPA